MLEVTGQLIFRDVGAPAPEPKSKTHRLVMVVGILAIPKESYNFKGEHQVKVGGNEHIITIDHFSAKDISEESVDCSIGNLLHHPIWRC